MLSASLSRSYDTIGRASGLALGSGYSVSYGYGSDGRLSGLSWKAAGVQDSVNYGYKVLVSKPLKQLNGS